MLNMPQNHEPFLTLCIKYQFVIYVSPCLISTDLVESLRGIMFKINSEFFLYFSVFVVVVVFCLFVFFYREHFK